MEPKSTNETPQVYGVELATVDSNLRFTFPKDFAPAVPDLFVLTLDENSFVVISSQPQFVKDIAALEAAKRNTMHAHVLCKLWETTAHWNNKLLAQNRFAIPAVHAMVAGIEPESQIVISSSPSGIYLAAASVWRDFQRGGSQASSERARLIIEAKAELAKEYVLPRLSDRGEL